MINSLFFRLFLFVFRLFLLNSSLSPKNCRIYLFLCPKKCNFAANLCPKKCKYGKKSIPRAVGLEAKERA